MYLTAPKGLKMVKLSKTSIRVSWNPIPDSDGRSVSGYRIKYAKSNSGDYDEMEVKSDQTEVEITGLEANTEYKIQVAGLHSDGKRNGPYTDQLEVRTTSSKYSVRIYVYTKFSIVLYLSSN